jgi:peptide/nickel transport system ATP-binding protein
MSAGQIVEAGTRQQIFQNPQHNYTRRLLAAAPRINPEWDQRRKLWEAHHVAQ